MDFLREWFGQDLRGNKICIFTLPQARSYPISDVLKLEDQYPISKSSDVYFDVYFQLGLSQDGKRASRDEINSLHGVWADIDFKAPFRKSNKLPEGLDDLRSLLSKIPHKPSYVINSGYGIHLYWIFREPWFFESEEDRAKAEKLSLGWHGFVCEQAKSLGWELQNLGDITRILRVPGTFNHKQSPPIPVSIFESCPNRYNPQDFEDFLIEMPSSGEGGGVFPPLSLTLTPPLEKFQALYSSNKTFRDTYHKKRKLEDSSTSAYDQSLADFAALNRWSDQEIAGLIIQFRQFHQDSPEKALREDYIRNTIQKARIVAKTNGVKDPEHPLIPVSLIKLTESFPTLRKPLIHGLLREGETMNVIAPPKTGKSWLTANLALHVATGTEWLSQKDAPCTGFPCEKGKVLIIDNELHEETSAHRIPRVCDALQMPIQIVGESLFIQNLRGRLRDLKSLSNYFLEVLKPLEFKLIVLDAFYRFLPIGTDENDNGAMADLYNHLDYFANELKCSFVLIHHTSKGDQSFKSVVDVGAGAGAQSRATDTHLILRRHKDDGCVVLDGAVRSWAPIVPRGLRWAFPLWIYDPDIDPTQLHTPASKHKQSKEVEEWDTKRFVKEFLTPKPAQLEDIIEWAREDEISRRRVMNFLNFAVEDQLAYRWYIDGKTMYAITPPPDHKANPKRELVAQFLRDNPLATVQDLVDRFHIPERSAYRYRSKFMRE